MRTDSHPTLDDLRKKLRDECEPAWKSDEAPRPLLPLEDAVDLWLRALVAPCEEEELRGLEELTVSALRGCIVSRAGDWSISLRSLCLTLEPFLWKVLYLCDKPEYERRRQRKSRGDKVAALYDLLILLRVTTKSVLAANSLDELRGQVGFAEKIGRVYFARIDAAHYAKLLSDAQRANAFIDVMIIYLLATAKNADGLRKVTWQGDTPKADGLGKLLRTLDVNNGREPTYVAHRYTLSQMTGLIGREEELNTLSQWIRDAKDRVFVLVAIGGMGKSALTWKWFNEEAPKVMRPLAGRMWWSFYAPEATFENFVARALAYVTGMSLDDVRNLNFSDRIQRLWKALDEEPFLLVLDGMERLLSAYGGMDAAYQSDAGEERPENVLPGGASRSGRAARKLRETADLRAGEFLRSLAEVKRSRVLLSSRIYPADLEGARDPLPGSCQYKLLGLRDDDAFALWKKLKVNGSKHKIVNLTNRFGNYPLLIRILASEIAAFHPAPGDFDAWLQAHPDFNPFAMDLKQVQTHVLKTALESLTLPERQTLEMIAAFRAPIKWTYLVDLMVKNRSWQKDAELTDRLTVLEDRGLVGWNRSESCYELHPVVRGVTWTRLEHDKRTKQGILKKKIAYLRQRLVPSAEVKRFEDLTPAVEVFLAQAELRQFQGAFETFRDYLDDPLYYLLATARYRLELLEQFPTQPGDKFAKEQLPYQVVLQHALGKAMMARGCPGDAVECFEEGQKRIAKLPPQFPSIRATIIGKDCEVNSAAELTRLIQLELAHAYRLSGKLRAGAQVARAALAISRAQSDRYLEGLALYRLGLVLSASGQVDEARDLFQTSLAIWKEFNRPDEAEATSNMENGTSPNRFYDLEGFVHLCLAQQALWEGNFAWARKETDAAAPLLEKKPYKNNEIHLKRLQGQIALELQERGVAELCLQEAAKEARAHQRVEEELQAVASLAQLRVTEGKYDHARRLLEEVCEAAERGPYPMFHAEARVVLGRLEKNAGHFGDAVTAATRAAELSQCDGPEYAFHWGLEKARALLRELEGPSPAVPAPHPHSDNGAGAPDSGDFPSAKPEH